MRILMLTPRFPYPPERGDTLRSWAALRGLAARHAVWLACVDHVAPRPEHIEHVQRRCRAVAVFVRSGSAALLRGARATLAGASFTEGYFGDDRLVQTVRRWSETISFDAVLTYSSSSAPAAEQVTARRRVLDLGDVDSRKWEAYARQSVPLRWFFRREARRVAALEQRAARAHDVCLLVNERERQKLVTQVPGLTTGVVPTTVDLADYALAPTTVLEPPPEPVIGMMGSMFYPPNVQAVEWFGRNVWPLVCRRLPAARWLIVGNRPARRVRRWARHVGVTVTGYVPDVRPHLGVMRVFVNPVIGDLGVQSKLVVALATGRPAVVTPDAAGGIEYAGPPPFLVASTPEEFAVAVVRLATNDQLWCALSRRARAVAEENYRAQRQVELLEFWLSEESARTGHAGQALETGCRANRRPVRGPGATEMARPRAKVGMTESETRNTEG